MSASLHALRVSADRLRQLEEETRSERLRRDELIADLVDSGESRSVIAATADVTPKTICTVLKLAG